MKCVTTVCSTFLHPLGQFADSSTHVDEGVEVLVEAVVTLPLQPGQRLEVGPVEGLPGRVVDHTVGRDGAVEVRLLPTSPPAAGDKDRKGRRQEVETVLLAVLSHGVFRRKKHIMGYNREKKCCFIVKYCPIKMN